MAIKFITLLIVVSFGILACTPQPKGLWITKAPAHQDDLGWIISGAQPELIGHLVATGRLSARLLHKNSGTFEIFSMTQRELYEATGIWGFRNQFWPTKVAIDLPLDLKKDTHLALTGANSVHRWNLGAGVKIAVIDTGLAIQHPDFQDRLFSNQNEVPDNGLDDDQNGLIDDFQGWNFADNSQDLSDSVKHGTAVAGIIVSPSNGLAPLAEVLPLKVMSASGKIDEASVIAAIHYAADRSVNIINISLGKSKVGPEFTKAVMSLEEKGILLVTAAGNDSKSCKVWKIYPAALSYDFIISVTATTLAKPQQLASYANYGSCVDFAIPSGDFGEGIPAPHWTTVASYQPFNGTSAASPVLAGLAALIKAQHPDYLAADIKKLLIQSALLPQELKDVVQYGIPQLDKVLAPKYLNSKK